MTLDEFENPVPSLKSNSGLVTFFAGFTRMTFKWNFLYMCYISFLHKNRVKTSIYKCDLRQTETHLNKRLNCAITDRDFLLCSHGVKMEGDGS